MRKGVKEKNINTNINIQREKVNNSRFLFIPLLSPSKFHASAVTHLFEFVLCFSLI